RPAHAFGAPRTLSGGPKTHRPPGAEEKCPAIAETPIAMHLNGERELLRSDGTERHLGDAGRRQVLGKPFGHTFLEGIHVRWESGTHPRRVRESDERHVRMRETRPQGPER